MGWYKELRAVLPSVRRHRFEPQHLIFSEGDPGDRVYLIRSGLVEIYLENFGNRRRLSLRGRGEVIGEMALLDGEPRSACALTKTAVDALSLDRSTFLALLENEPHLIRRLTSEMSRRMRDLQRTLVEQLEERERTLYDQRLGQVGPYILHEEINRGGSGVIYRATHERRTQSCAVKVIPLNSLEDRQRFQRECEMMARLIHPNIVRIESGGLVGSIGYLVMELVEGESLDQRLLRGPLRHTELAHWFRPVISALQYAQSSQLVHRDVKPGNILMALDGTVRLIDFGLARRLSGPEVTSMGQYFGTPHYLAPERIGGRRNGQEKYSDQYSLGASLYHALKGEPPFAFPDIAEVLAGHLHQSPQPLHECIEVPIALSHFVAKLLAKDPLQRSQSMAELSMEFEQALVSSGTDSLAATTGFEG